MERRTLYGGGLSTAGLLLAGTQLVQGIQQIDGFEGADRAVVFTFETVPFVLIGLTLTFVGYWLTSQSQYELDLPRILAWGVGSTLLFASVAALILFSQQVTSDSLEQAQYIAMNQITVGAAVGTLVGLYDARSRLRQRELLRERDRVERFAQKAADINNYGRELNRSESLDEVSSLCIQALQAFLQITELAVIVTDREESELVDNTVVNAPPEALFEIAAASLDQEPAAVVTQQSTPDAVGEERTVISMLLTEHEDSAVVLLAFTDRGTDFAEEDIQLLEMLVAHAATAIERIYEQQLSAPDNEASRAHD
jgi:GAF domain-containing protein